MCLNNDQISELTFLARSTKPTENIIGISTTRNHVHAAAGLNWGYNAGTAGLADAYIPVNTDDIAQNSSRFIKTAPNRSISCRWDDGTEMSILVEQNSSYEDGVNQYGKAISSVLQKHIIGDYLRTRIGDRIGRGLVHSDYARRALAEIKQNSINKEEIINAIRNNPTLDQELRDKFITTNDLIAYGRTTISLSILEDGTYYFNFAL